VLVVAIARHRPRWYDGQLRPSGCLERGLRGTANMSVLLEQLGTEPQRQQVVAECVDLIDAQVKTKGFFVRSAYATIKALKRDGAIAEVVDSMLDGWLARLQPHYDRWVAAGKGAGFGAHLVAHADEVAEDLLAVTDARAERSTRSTVKKLYARLRDSAKRNVVEALPALGPLLERRLPALQQAATA
jgi:hypothetical protein